MKGKKQRWNEIDTNRNPLYTPVSGLNDNLEFMGRQLHIQTENTGFPEARIVTQVFSGGRVILSRKADHPSVIGDSARIRELMNSQHLQIIKEIKDKQTRIRGSH